MSHKLLAQLRSHHFFFFFFSETGHPHCSEEDLRFPAGTTGTVWKPYKPDRSCEYTVCEVVRERGQGRGRG